ACALACGGMALMFHEDEPWNIGDTLTLCSTLFYAIYILTLEESARRHATEPLRASRLATAQASVMCAAAFILLLERHGSRWSTGMDALDAPALAALLYLGLLASVLVVTLQAWGQQRVDALRSAIIFGLEPVFAAMTAWALLGERMGLVALAGATLVILALIWSQWQPDRVKPST
ncbi:MAG: EamA family transporter, partial [Giesbergeria sp.]